MHRQHPQPRPPRYSFQEGARVSERKFSFHTVAVMKDSPWTEHCEGFEMLKALIGTEVKWETVDFVDYAKRVELFWSGLIEFAFDATIWEVGPGTLTIGAEEEDLTFPNGMRNRAHVQNFDVWTP